MLLPPSQNSCRWGSALKCHLGLALPKLLKSGLWHGQGATGRSVIMVLRKNKFSEKKTGVIYRIGPPKKALFGGIRDLVLVPSKGKPASGETPGYLGGRLRRIQAMVPPKLLRKSFYISGKNAKTARILPHSMIILMSSVGVMKNLFVHADFL